MTACVFGGEGVEPLAQEAISYGADKVLLAEDGTLADFRVEPQAALLAKAVREAEAAAVIIGATFRGRELAPRAGGGIGYRLYRRLHRAGT